MKNILILSIFYLQLVLVSSTILIAQNQAVKHYVLEEEILEHNQLPLDPYPPFGFEQLK